MPRHTLWIGRSRHDLHRLGQCHNGHVQPQRRVPCRDSGPRHRLGVEAFVGSADDSSTLLDLLVPYSRSDERSAADPDEEALEHALDRFRHDVAAIPLVVDVEGGESVDEYRLRISSQSALQRNSEC